MFQLAPEETFVRVDPASILSLHVSVNAMQVLLPGRPSALAQAVVVGFREGPGFGVLLALHLTEAGEHLVYRHDGGLLDGDGARVAAAEGLEYAESMGFFMEPQSWRELDPVARIELLAGLKVFQPPVKAAVERARPVDPRTKLARLLVQL